MIDRIIIENFKSLRKVDLSLGSLNLFIGTNASGKSNFLDALRILQGIGNGFTISEVLDGKPRSATAEVWEGIRGGSSNASYYGTDVVTIAVFGTSDDRFTDSWEYLVSFSPAKGRVIRERFQVGEVQYNAPVGTPGVRERAIRRLAGCQPSVWIRSPWRDTFGRGEFVLCYRRSCDQGSQPAVEYPTMRSGAGHASRVLAGPSCAENW